MDCVIVERLKNLLKQGFQKTTRVIPSNENERRTLFQKKKKNKSQVERGYGYGVYIISINQLSPVSVIDLI